MKSNSIIRSAFKTLSKSSHRNTLSDANAQTAEKFQLI